MARYDSDWRDRQRGWGGGWRTHGGHHGERGEGRGHGWRGQPWASRRPRSWYGMQARGYGVEYRGRGAPYSVGYRRGSAGRFGSRAERGTGYDFGYQGGEWGRPVNARDFGSRGSYGTPGRRMNPDWNRDWTGAYRSEEFTAGYGRDFDYENVRRRTGAPWAFRRGRGTEYGADFAHPEGGIRGRRAMGPRGYAREFGPREEEGDLGRVPGHMGSDDFGGHAHRHYGHTPIDRWPAHEAAEPYARMDDEEVRESVRENLFQDSFIDPDRIDVDVDAGVVTLRGEVDDFLEARYAWDDAWESPGVRGVVNHLTVRTDRASDEMEMPQTEHGGGEV